MDPAVDPIEQFRVWFAEAERSEPHDANAMAIATVGADGTPSARMVLMKDFSSRGFVFYTNYESPKGEHLLATPKAAICFHWKSLGRQVRIEGAVETVSDADADAYFASRPRDSQIGAWASRQSRAMKGRFELERQIAHCAAKYALGAVPRPPYWSGFCVVPERIEFWRQRAFRLHDRLVYQRAGDGWSTERLYP